MRFSQAGNDERSGECRSLHETRLERRSFFDAKVLSNFAIDSDIENYLTVPFLPTTDANVAPITWAWNEASAPAGAREKDIFCGSLWTTFEACGSRINH